MTSYSLLARLHQDWTTQRDDPSTHDWLTARAHDEPALRGYSSLAEVECAVQDRAVPLADVDSVLAALLRLQHHGDHDAGSVLLGLLLPAIGRWARTRNYHDDHVEQFVAELWYGICHYPLARRTRAIAANLVRDARQRAERAYRSEHPEQLPRHLPDQAADEALTRMEDRLDLRRAIRRAAVTEHELALMVITRVGGARLPELTTTSREVDRLRQRRHRAERRLRAALVDNASHGTDDRRHT